MKTSRRRKNGSLAPFAVAGLALAAGAVAYHSQRTPGADSAAGWKKERLPAGFGKGYRYTRTINGMQYEVEENKDTDDISLRVGERNERIYPPGNPGGNWRSVAEAQREAEQDARFMGTPTPKRSEEDTAWTREKVDGGYDHSRVINGMPYTGRVRTNESYKGNKSIALVAGTREERIHPPGTDWGSWPSVAEAKRAAEEIP